MTIGDAIIAYPAVVCERPKGICEHWDAYTRCTPLLYRSHLLELEGTFRLGQSLLQNHQLNITSIQPKILEYGVEGNGENPNRHLFSETARR